MFDCYVEMFTCFNLDDPKDYLIYNQGREDVYLGVSWTQIVNNCQRLTEQGGILYISQDTKVERALCDHLSVNGVPFKVMYTGRAQRKSR